MQVAQLPHSGSLGVRSNVNASCPRSLVVAAASLPGNGPSPLLPSLPPLPPHTGPCSSLISHVMLRSPVRHARQPRPRHQPSATSSAKIPHPHTPGFWFWSLVGEKTNRIGPAFGLAHPGPINSLASLISAVEPRSTACQLLLLLLLLHTHTHKDQTDRAKNSTPTGWVGTHDKAAGQQGIGDESTAPVPGRTENQTAGKEHSAEESPGEKKREGYTGC